MAEQYPHTAAVLTLFEQTNRPVGDAKGPKGPDEVYEDSDYPYSVIYEGTTIWWRMTGPLNAPQADTQYIYNVVYVGRWAAQARALAQRGRLLVQRDNIVVPEHKTRDFRFEELGPTVRDDDIRPPVFTISDLYLLDVTPIG